MSIQFSDTSTKKGLVQFYEKEIGANYGDVSGDDDLLKGFTADCNIAFDDFLNLAFGPSGSWQIDDSNHTDYPEIKANLVSGQRDYPFTTDGSSNLILDIYKVLVKGTDGVFRELKARDKQTLNSNNHNTDLWNDGRDQTGIPTEYDKTANGIIFNYVPNYNSTLGIKMLVNREASYFVSTDTTKKPGVPGTLHKWFYIKPAFEYARIKSLANYNTLAVEVARLEGQIVETFRRRQRDVKPGLRALTENTR